VLTRRLALVGASSIFQDGLRAVLNAVEEFRIVGEAQDMAGALHAIGRCHPDVLLIDTESVESGWLARLPDLHGHADGPAPRVLLLIVSADDGQLMRAAAAGVDGWVLKDEETADLVAAIRALSSGYAWLSPQVARRLLDHWRDTLAAPPKPPSEEVDRLSRRELSVLGLVAHGCSNAEIADELVLGEATVKTHVSRILTKLDLHNRVQLAAFAHRNGLTE
jgi:DNA-binding NarL/FixJ family response regulator